MSSLELYYPELEKNVSFLRNELSSEDFDRYFHLLCRYFDGIIQTKITLENELSWLPETVIQDHKNLLSKVTILCKLEPNFEEFEEDVRTGERALPYPASINARVLLQSLKEGLACPDVEIGMKINYTLRNSVFEIIEMALRVKKTFKLEESGFLKMYIDNNAGRPTVLQPRDFFDSLAFYHNSLDGYPSQLETNEAMCNFFAKMLVGNKLEQ